jgi:hypothetical protein
VSKESKKTVQAMTEHKGPCCSSPSAMCYWFAASLTAWGVLSLIGIYWRPLNASSAATILFAMAIGCVANWLRHRTFHCAITGPLFLVAAVVFLLSDVSSAHLNSLLVWPFVLIGVGIAFLLEGGIRGDLCHSVEN